MNPPPKARSRGAPHTGRRLPLLLFVAAASLAMFLAGMHVEAASIFPSKSFPLRPACRDAGEDPCGARRPNLPAASVRKVVIVDDGSNPPLARPSATPLDVRLVRQERHGFGLARTRNTGFGPLPTSFLS